ncbi:MAG: hypothetical protein IV099_06295 [Phenylobacterium sp.]|uniref:hypothetical protein n=1 Tax=Phenylobacterium sp. TaxID=1871053 RepID=UPI0025D0E568|nr:hypothetical protein [Phenylobacterium sp.]MBT9470778.1 hypothetical protein [Phenylobacterium sp.]
MADRPKSSGDINDGPGHRSAGATPRWVKVFGIIGLVLVALFVVLHLTGHGFGRQMHMSSPEHGVQRP